MSEAVVKVFEEFGTKVGEKINLLNQKIENTLTLGQDIADLQNSLSDLDEYLHGSFAAGILDPARIQAITQQLNNLQADKSSIDSKFEIVNNSAFLSDIVRQGLVDEKENFDAKHNALVAAIEDAIADGEGTEEELENIQSLFLEYRAAIGQYTLTVENALETITANRIESIKPGTRNILLDSKTAQFTHDGNFLRFHFSAIEIRWDNTEIRWDNEEVSWNGGKPNVSSELLEGDHIVSVDVVSDVSQAITLKLTDGMEASSERVWELEADRRTRVYVHLKAGWGNQTLDFSIEKHVPDADLEVSGLKLAQGNKSDSYSPAPEDVEKAIEKTRREVTEAYQNYADAEAERAELEAKLWADGKLTALEKMLLADATAKANAARRYAEAQDTHLEVLTKAYADGKIDALESELIDLSEANLTAAQGYVDAQILLEQVRSDGYVDEEIATERQRAIDDAQQKYDDAVAEAESLAGAARDAALQDAQNKYDAAISHANAEAALAQANAIADADGKITAEEAARIQALEDYEAAAQDYADAAQALAETNAAAYADGKITEEEAARIAEAEANLLEAKQHATSLADAIDLRIDSQNTYIQQLAEDNLEAAKDYAEAQDTALQTAIQAYADGIVSDAEARAIAEAQAEAQLAKDYAEAQDALLDTAIRAYADGEITDAEARAIHEAELKVQAVRGELETLRTDLEDEIDQVNSRIDTLETDTLAAIEDGILTQAEISNLKSQKNLLDKEKTDVDRRYQITHSNPHLEGDAKDDLADAEGIYQTAYTALSDYYEDIFATGEIPGGDPVALLDAYRNALAEFSSAMDEALSAIAQKKADLAEGAALLQINNRLNNEIIPAINDAQDAADALQFITEQSFWDGLLDENEAKALQLHIEPLETEKEDIYSKYAVVYTNELLKDPYKENLYQAYDNYDDAHTALIDAIQALAVGEITPAKRQAVSNAFEAHRTALQALTTAFEEAAKAIEYEHIDQIIVGTRNLILGEVEFTGDDTRTAELTGESIRWDSTEVRWDSTEVRWDSGHPNLSTDNLVGQHAIGLDIIVPTQRTIRIEIRDTVAPYTVKAREHLVAAGRKTRIGAIGEGKEGNTGFVVTVLNAQGAEISGVKLEIGNKWTDWNESPEDVGDKINQARLNAQTAAEAYAKAEAEKQALLVKVHADGKITQMEKRLLDHADAVANAARRYSEAEDQHLQILLESYADGEIDDMEAALIQLSNDNLAAANQAAQAAANAAQTAAKAYADGEIDDMEAALMSYADNAASAAETAALAADEALQSVLESYADGVVDAEEAARNAALADYAEAAEAYADAARELAEIAAKSYADGKISDAEARAIADATAKMNEAKQHAQNLINGLRIGTRNLLKDSRKEVSSGSYQIAQYNLVEPIPDGAQVTISIKGQLSAGKTYFGLYNTGGSVNLAELYPSDQREDGVYVRTFNWRIAGAANTRLHIYQMPNGVTHASEIEWVQLQYGNVATEWSPAEVSEEDWKNYLQTKAILEEKTNFLTTTIDGNVIATGTLAVGDASGQNAGITGVTDRIDPVRYWGGGTFSNRYKARWRAFDSGTNEFGGIGTDAFIRIGVDEFGEPVIKFFRNDGSEAWNLNINGIHFPNFQPEQFRLSELLYLGNSSSDSSLLQHFEDSLKRNHPPLQRPLPPEAGGGTEDVWNCYNELDTTRYRYYAGNNFTSDNNRYLEAYHFAQQNKDIEDPANLVSDGWYMVSFSFQVPESYRGVEPYEFSCFRILDGQNVEGGYKTVQFYPSLNDIPIQY